MHMQHAQQHAMPMSMSMCMSMSMHIYRRRNTRVACRVRTVPLVDSEAHLDARIPVTNAAAICHAKSSRCRELWHVSLTFRLTWLRLRSRAHYASSMCTCT